MAAETRLPNDQWDGGIAEGEWKPRPRTVVVGGVEWLARMSDKARAKANGTIGDYIYPCPADKRLLQALELEPEVFMGIATKASNDDDVVAGVKAKSPTMQSGTFSFSMNTK